MKILFLDIDGVLNHSESPGWRESWEANGRSTTFGPTVLDDECVARLKEVVAKTRCALVISSAWRFYPSHMKVLREKLTPPCIIWGTTSRLPLANDIRSYEIRHWFDNNPQVSAYAVVDDENDANLGDGSFVKTDFQAGGLTQAHADKLIEILNTPQTREE